MTRYLVAPSLEFAEACVQPLDLCQPCWMRSATHCRKAGKSRTNEKTELDRPGLLVAAVTSSRYTLAAVSSIHVEHAMPLTSASNCRLHEAWRFAALAIRCSIRFVYVRCSASLQQPWWQTWCAPLSNPGQVIVGRLWAGRGKRLQGHTRAILDSSQPPTRACVAMENSCTVRQR